MRLLKCVFAIALFFIGVGCVQPPTILPPMPRVSSPEHYVDCNASKNTESRATVGDAVLRVKDYWVVRRNDGYMTPSCGFTHTGGPNVIRVEAGSKLKVYGTTTIDGRVFSILNIPGDSAKILVDNETMTLNTRVINFVFTPTVMAWNFISSPSVVTFKEETISSIEAKSSYVNYEFIYSGKSGSSLNFLYREFTAEDLAKQAFFQNVSYESSEKTIQFKSIKLEVIEASSGYIRVKVIDY